MKNRKQEEQTEVPQPEQKKDEPSSRIPAAHTACIQFEKEGNVKDQAENVQKLEKHMPAVSQKLSSENTDRVDEDAFCKVKAKVKEIFVGGSAPAQPQGQTVNSQRPSVPVSCVVSAMV